MKKLHEVLAKFKDLPGTCLNYETKVTRYPTWTEIRIYGKLTGIPYLRALPIEKDK